MNSNVAKYGPWVLAAAFLVVIIVQQLRHTDEIDKTVQAFEKRVRELEVADSTKAAEIIDLQANRDTDFEKVEDKPKVDKAIIHNKHEKDRTNFRLLPRSNRVSVFADRYKGR